MGTETRTQVFRIKATSADCDVNAELDDLVRVVSARLEESGEVDVLVSSDSSLLTTTQAAQVLGVSRQFLTRLLDNDVMPSIRLEDSSHRRVPLSAVKAFVAERERKLRATEALSQSLDAFPDTD